MEIIAFIVLIGLSAFFSGSEIAFVVANRLRVEVLARRGGTVGPLVRRMLHDPESFLATPLVGNVVVLVVFSTLLALILREPLNLFFVRDLGVSPEITLYAVPVTQTILTSVILLVFGQIVPRSIVREVATQAVFSLAVPLRAANFLMLPVVKLTRWSASALVRLFNLKAESVDQFIQHDFEIILQENIEGGDLELDEQNSTLVENVFALNAIRVRESMVPRTDIEAIEESSSIESVRRRFIESGHSKLPVYKDNIDHITGVAFAHDLFKQPVSLAEMKRSAKFVPESKRSKDLLQEFLATNSSIAIVIDEYGGTAGLVTREDLLEELFGDIQDEFDTDTEVLRQVGENAYTVSGRVHIDELEERFDLKVPEGDYDTVAGYLLDRLGTIPNTREEFDFDGFHFIILKATPRRIDLVRIIKKKYDL